MIYLQKISNRYLLITSIFLLLGSIQLIGQVDMISQTNWDVSDLSGEQVIRYQKINTPSNNYITVTKITIGNLSNSLQDGRLKINVESF